MVKNRTASLGWIWLRIWKLPSYITNANRYLQDRSLMLKNRNRLEYGWIGKSQSQDEVISRENGIMLSWSVLVQTWCSNVSKSTRITSNNSHTHRTKSLRTKMLCVLSSPSLPPSLPPSLFLARSLARSLPPTFPVCVGTKRAQVKLVDDLR